MIQHRCETAWRVVQLDQDAVGDAHCLMLLAEPLPQRMRAWQIKGTGFDHFGAGGAPDEIPFPGLWGG